MATTFRVMMRTMPIEKRRVAAHLHRRLAIGSLLLVGVLLVLLLAGHNAAMAAAPHDAFATGARVTTPVGPEAHAAARHYSHAVQLGSIEVSPPSPASQSCFTSQPEVIPSGTDCPNRAVAAAADIHLPRASQPRETAPETIAPPPARVRRALLQVYLN